MYIRLRGLLSVPPPFPHRLRLQSASCWPTYCRRAGPCVEGSVLVEDEVADAVIDRFPPVGLGRLERVAVVSYDGICPGIDQSVCLLALPGDGP